MLARVKRYLCYDATEVNTLKERIEAEYGNILKKNSSKTVEVGPKGGMVLLSECRIRIPKGALKEKISLKLSLSREYFELSPEYVPVTSVLTCEPAVTFECPVTVTIDTTIDTTCAPSNPNDGTCCCKLFGTCNVGGLKLKSDYQAVFETKVLDTHVLAVNVNENVLFQMVKHVYIQKESALVVSFLCWNNHMLNYFTKALESKGFDRLMPKRKYLNFKYGDCVKTAMELKAPKQRMLFTKDQQKFKANDKILRSAKMHSVFYKVHPSLDEYEGPIKMEYTTTTSDEKITEDLESKWQPAKMTKESAPAKEHFRGVRTSNSTATSTQTALAHSDAIAAVGNVYQFICKDGPITVLLIAIIMCGVGVLLLKYMPN